MRPITALILLIGWMALAGCQQAPTATVELPPPNLGQPQITPAPPPAKTPAPAKPVPVPSTPLPRKTVAANVPRDWVPPVPARPWRWIIIHHSATAFGNAQIIDGWHKNKGWDELGYDFVIDNGTSGTADGQIEVGPRWIKQKWGAHTKTADNRFNDFGIGICLVGNFDETQPTAAQMKSVAKLVAYMMYTYNITADRVLGHRDAKPTDCPGKNMSVAEVRRLATEILTAEGKKPKDAPRVAGGQELLHDAQGD